MKIIVDTSEPPKVQKAIKKLHDDVEIAKCDIGDIVCGDVCIERKEIGDFVGSIVSGHIQKQLIQMKQFKFPYLLISGSFKAWQFAQKFNKSYSTKGFGIEPFLGALSSVAVRYGVTVLMVDNDTQLCKLAVKLITKTYDGKEVTIRDTELLKNSLTTDDIKIKVLTCFEGIGPKKALKLKESVKISDMLDTLILELTPK